MATKTEKAGIREWFVAQGANVERTSVEVLARLGFDRAEARDALRDAGVPDKKRNVEGSVRDAILDEFEEWR